MHKANNPLILIQDFQGKIILYQYTQKKDLTADRRKKLSELQKIQFADIYLHYTLCRCAKLEKLVAVSMTDLAIFVKNFFKKVFCQFERFVWKETGDECVKSEIFKVNFIIIFNFNSLHGCEVILFFKNKKNLFSLGRSLPKCRE